MRDDPVWNRIQGAAATPARPLAHRPRGWALGVASLLLLAGLWPLTHGSAIGPRPAGPQALTALAPGPVTPVLGTNVQQLAAALATAASAAPTSVFWTRGPLSQVVRTAGASVAGATNLRQTVTTIWVAGRVPGGVPRGSLAVGAGESGSLLPYTSPSRTAGMAVEVLSGTGTLLGEGVVDGLRPDSIKKMAARPVWWPNNWAQRLWARPWWPAGPSADVVDPMAVRYTVISRAAAKGFMWPPPGWLAGWRALPRQGPVYLVEAPTGQGWLVDATTGQSLPFDWGGGWFPLSHYGQIALAPRASGPPGVP